MGNLFSPFVVPNNWRNSKSFDFSRPDGARGRICRANHLDRS